MKLDRRCLICIIVLLSLIGLALICSPYIEGWIKDKAIEDRTNAFRQQLPTEPSQDPGIKSVHSTAAKSAESIAPELLEDMRSYNEKIYQEEQCELVDTASYKVQIIDLTEYGIEDEAVGVISVPKIDLEMPLYLGATSAHLDKGFAQLSQTSAPIGGENTNCVVAGHRGWRNAQYFYRAHELEIGDLVYLENYWEVLTYKVVEIKTILPSDRDSILIQPGRDLLTLFTCTPYRVNSHRLLVICERIQNTEARIKGGNNNA